MDVSGSRYVVSFWGKFEVVKLRPSHRRVDPPPSCLFQGGFGRFRSCLRCLGRGETMEGEWKQNHFVTSWKTSTMKICHWFKVQRCLTQPIISHGKMNFDLSRISNYVYSLKLTAIAPENRPSQKERIVFQPSIFRGELLVSGRVTPPKTNMTGKFHHEYQNVSI